MLANKFIRFVLPIRSWNISYAIVNPQNHGLLCFDALWFIPVMAKSSRFDIMYASLHPIILHRDIIHSTTGSVSWESIIRRLMPGFCSKSILFKTVQQIAKQMLVSYIIQLQYATREFLRKRNMYFDHVKAQGPAVLNHHPAEITRGFMQPCDARVHCLFLCFIEPTNFDGCHSIVLSNGRQKRHWATRK